MKYLDKFINCFLLIEILKLISLAIGETTNVNERVFTKALILTILSVLVDFSLNYIHKKDKNESTEV